MKCQQAPALEAMLDRGPRGAEGEELAAAHNAVLPRRESSDQNVEIGTRDNRISTFWRYSDHNVERKR